MTCVYKEYEIKTKMVQEKLLFSEGGGAELTFGKGRVKIWWDRISTREDFSS